MQSLKNSISAVSGRPIFYIYRPFADPSLLDLHCCCCRTFDLSRSLVWPFPFKHNVRRLLSVYLCGRAESRDACELRCTFNRKGNNKIQRKGGGGTNGFCPGQLGRTWRSASRKVEQTFAAQITLPEWSPDSKLRFQTSLSWTGGKCALWSSHPAAHWCCSVFFHLFFWRGAGLSPPPGCLPAGVWEQTRF